MPHDLIWGNDATTSCGGVLNGNFWMRFTYCPNLMFLASPWLEIYRFSDWSFCWLWAVQNWVIFLLLASQNWPYLFIFTDFRQITVFLLSLGKMLGHKKQSKPSPFWQKIQEPYHRISHKSFSMIQAGIKNWVPQLINRLQRLNLLFLSVTHFSE